MSEEFIERRIVTGLIVSTEYIQEIEPIWSPKYLESETARLLSGWCLEYFRQYRKAPGRDIEGIYTDKIKMLGKTQAQDIEEVLAGLSDEFDRGQFNVEYLMDQTKTYFKERSLILYTEDIQEALRGGDVTEAERLAMSFSPVATELSGIIDPLASASLIRKAFTDSSQPLIKYPKALGRFWNKALCRDSFVALMGTEKRGKSWWLMDLTIRAMTSGCKVVMFEAGDMTMEQWIRRVCIYLAGRNDDPDYCAPQWIPVVDCWHNQTDTCDREEREGSFGIFPQGTDQKTITQAMLIERAKTYPEYQPCHNCPHIRGTVWLKWQEQIRPLDWRDAVKIAKKWNNKYQHRMRLASYPNETLTISEIRSKLEQLEKQEDFIPDVIIIDYVDIMSPDKDCVRLDKLEQTNRNWQRLRRLSQELHCLVITATQAAATAYDKESLGLKDFSDNKKKYAHVTATYALNQTDEEKRLGVMRIGKMVVREEAFDRATQIHVLQHLHRGRPCVGNFF